MKTDLQKFQDFKKRHNLTNEQITKIIIEYANSDMNLARTHFAEKYNISEATFYKARDFAVICCLVNNEICRKLRDKAAYNYGEHNESKIKTQSYNHFQEIYEKRIAFYETVFSNSDIRNIGYKYIEGVEISKIACEYEVCEEIINRLLQKGILKLIFIPRIIIGIKRRVEIKRGNIARIASIIEEYKKTILKNLQNEIDLLNFQIENYETYFSDDSIVNEKEFLIKRLQEVTEKYKLVSSI